MTGWIVLPISLTAFSIPGIWIVYAMAVMNHHVCPVENWTYNVTCSDDTAKQGMPKSCCTLEHVPLIRGSRQPQKPRSLNSKRNFFKNPSLLLCIMIDHKCGSYPPESCLFSLIGNVGAFMVVMICLLRYSQVIELSHSSWLNTVALISGCINAAGLVMVGNFQVDHAKSLHYIGAGVAFPAGLLFVCLHCILTYHLATSTLDYWVGHLRVSLTIVALASLVLSGVFFIHESFLLQHLAAICEWIFVLDILVFYGTFSYEFGSVSSDTIMAALQSSSARSCKSPGSSSTSTHLNCNPERIAMI